ncbi:MAG: hypothetical protein QXT99_08990 [Candidatus Nitrosotenuis sp.]
MKEHKLQLLIAFSFYLICAIVFGLAYRYAINPDGIAELRLAGYIAEWHFMRSVTQNWSALFLWLMSPFLFLGFDGLTTARVTIALSGALLLFCCWLFIQRFNLSRKQSFIVLLIVALLISDWTIRNIGADILFATLLILYMYFVTHPDIINNKQISFFCGVWGGFSYLAHHYAFPFFVIHYPISLILRKYISKNPPYGLLRPIVVGFVGFIIICSLWIIPMSIKYSHLAISGKGGPTYAAFGPQSSGGHPFFKGGLYKPRDSYAIHVFENLSEMKFNKWSPFESKEYFLHQLKLMKMNINYIFSHFVRSSPFFTYPFMIALLSIIPIVLLIVPIEKEKKFLYSWVVITFLIYCSGFILIIARSPRRFYMPMLLMIITSFSILEGLIRFFNEKYFEGQGDVWKRRLLILYILLITVPAFSLKPAIHLMKSFKNILTLEYVNPYKDIAEQLKQVDFPAPVAFIRSSQKGHTDLYIAYFLNKQLLGRPISNDIDGITEELKITGGRSLLVFDNLDVVDILKNDSRYTHLATIELRKDERYWNAPNIEQDEIKAWDKEVNIFVLKDNL